MAWSDAPEERADAAAAPAGGIRTPDQRLRVFVSSVPGELGAEQAAARQAVEQLRLAPVLAESGARPHRAREASRAYVRQSDVFVGIYWQQYGAPGTAGISRIEEEFRLAAGKPRLLYVKRPAPDVEPGLRRMLDGIRSAGDEAYKVFADAGELRELMVTDLVTTLTERFDLTSPESPPQPAPPTSLVGREGDVAEVTRLVEAGDRRLLVLTGAGGIGKTRLALAVLERSQPHWRDGAAFVDLSSVTDPDLVPEAIAAGLAMAAQGRESPLDTLRRRLAGRHMLLVLDNFEQVLDAAPVVADLMQWAPGLQILVTSRVVLRVRGEQEWRVEPLGLVPAGGAEGALAQAPAVRLLVERVRDVRPGFELTSQNAAVVAELCRRLDGLPLALELAAAWMRLLSPEQVLRRLDEQLARPGALVDLPDRQQTLTATIEWSYDLLAEPEQELLARLSVFAAPFTAEEAVATCGRADVDAVDGLSVLLQHSMVSPAARPDGEQGFRLLDTIRRFAAQRLGDADEPLGRLERFLLDALAGAAASQGSQAGAIRTLDSEQLNLQAVLAWMIRRRRPPGPMLHQIAAVWVWLLIRGYTRRRSELLRQIEALSDSELLTDSDRVTWQWLIASGMLNDGRFAELGELADMILPEARRVLDPAWMALLLMGRAIARPYTVGSPARAELEEALAVLHIADDPLALGYVRSHLGFFLLVDGDVGRARELHGDVLRSARRLADENQRAEAHYDLGMDDLAAGDPGSAHAHLVVAAGHYQDIDNADGLTRCLGGLSALALERDNAALAARLMGATAAARDEIGLTPWPLVTEAERRSAARVAAALPGAEFAAQVASGRAQAADDALALALADLGGRVPAGTW